MTSESRTVLQRQNAELQTQVATLTEENARLVADVSRLESLVGAKDPRSGHGRTNKPDHRGDTLG